MPATARLFAKEGAAGIAILDLERDREQFQSLARELSAQGTRAMAIPAT